MHDMYINGIVVNDSKEFEDASGDKALLIEVVSNLGLRVAVQPIKEFPVALAAGDEVFILGPLAQNDGYPNLIKDMESGRLIYYVAARRIEKYEDGDDVPHYAMMRFMEHPDDIPF